jgi:hypothetical protein
MPDATPEPPAGRSFEDMLADPGEQFDPRSELLASIAAYAAAPSDTPSAAPRPLTAPGVVAGLLADVADARAQLAGVQHGAGAWIREAVARETAGLTARLAEVTAERDKAYRERAHLVAHLAACHPSVMLTDSAEPDWPIVFVSTSAGQMSWHIAKADLELFGHVPATTEPTWDGHTTEEKYQRLAELVRTLSYLGPPAQVDASIAEGKLDQLREQLGVIRDRLGNLAAGLDLSASASRPSKKSEIESGCAAAVRQIAESIEGFAEDEAARYGLDAPEPAEGGVMDTAP